MRISVCSVLVFADPDPDYRNPASRLVRPLNSLVCLGGFPVLFKCRHLDTRFPQKDCSCKNTEFVWELKKTTFCEGVLK